MQRRGAGAAGGPWASRGVWGAGVRGMGWLWGGLGARGSGGGAGAAGPYL